jgi:hypothetical protein
MDNLERELNRLRRLLAYNQKDIGFHTENAQQQKIVPKDGNYDWIYPISTTVS